MRLVQGNFLDQNASVFVFSANGLIRQPNRPYSRLVMGRGAARAMLTKFEGADVWIAGEIKRKGVVLYSHLGETVYSYAGVAVYFNHGITIGALQVKEHWRDPAKMERLSEGVDFWRDWALANPGQQISMNFPGIGLGGLRESVVLPVISTLPDNVTVCRL